MDPASIAIIVVLVLSIVLHEVAHGYAANWLGDPTARLAGRLTLNPLPHIDPLGSVIIPALLYFSSAGFVFGYAKPVPYNPYNLKNQTWGESFVAAAGPFANFLLAGIFSLLIRFSETLGLSVSFIDLAETIVLINLVLALFNLIPFPPLDGSKIIEVFLPLTARARYREFVMRFERLGFLGTVVFLFVFISIFWEPFRGVIFFVFRLFTGL